MIMICLHGLTIILRTNTDGPDKIHILDTLESIALYFYALEMVLGVLGYGLYFGDKTYLKETMFNYINVIVFLLTIVSEIKIIGELETRLIRRFTTLKILTFFTRTNK